MTSTQLLTWALLATSLFNTILLLWLGIIVWFNAERRTWGVALAGGGFILGSLFFISHSALLLSESLSFTRSNTLWLAVGMTPVVVLPFVWYVVLLWYAGYWTGSGGELRRRHRPWLWITAAILAIGFVCLALLGIPHIPWVARLTTVIWPLRQVIKAPVIGEIPLVAVGYPLYVLLCVALSLDALRRPGITERMMGDLARRRAQPWLTAASLLLLGVAVLVAAVVVWTITHTAVGGYYIIYGRTLTVIGEFDLVISLLIAGVTAALGQAMTAYELFTGKALPRQGLARQWKRALLLAAGYGVLTGGALVRGLQPVYAVLLTASLMTAFFALLSWRSYVEWDEAMRRLRPFVTSQHLYDSLLTAPSPAEEATEPFAALCSSVLDTTVAYLIPAGPSAALVAGQSYPASRSCPAIGPLLERPLAGLGLIMPVEPGQYAGATWAIPLWGLRGLTGILLVGPRRGNGLYTQEEIEIARSTGERLVDTAASTALSQRLMQLQRERMAATQILDQRTRRVLHDEVLPLIHTAMLSLSAGKPADAVLAQLSDAHQEVSKLLRELVPTVLPEIARLGLIGALRRMLDVEFAQAFEAVTWHCEAGVEALAAGARPQAAETLYYAAREIVRNAAKHARRPDGDVGLRLTITAQASASRLQITIADNGIGLPQQMGGGQGLALHSTLMAVVGGSLALESAPGQRTQVQLTLPLAG